MKEPGPNNTICWIGSILKTTVVENMVIRMLKSVMEGRAEIRGDDFFQCSMSHGQVWKRRLTLPLNKFLKK